MRKMARSLVLGFPFWIGAFWAPSPVLENKGFAARSAVSSCKHFSYRQSPLNKGVSRDFFGRGGGVGWQIVETSRTSLADHWSNHLGDMGDCLAAVDVDDSSPSSFQGGV